MNSRKYAYLKVNGEESEIIIPVDTNKPEIPELIQGKWQRIVDLVARIMQVPAGLITHFTADELEIFTASRTSGNPYKKDDSDRLGIGMFCETVAGSRKRMIVHDAESEEFWRKNPHSGFGMKSYLGVPIEWSDGELFGTFCMLSDRANIFTSLFVDLMTEFKEIIETDLLNILLGEELNKQLSSKDLELREIHHRVKNNYNMLISLIKLKGSCDEVDVEEILADIERRIRAMSLLHEKIYSSPDTTLSDLGNYLNELILILAEDIVGSDLKINTEIDQVNIGSEASVSLALILCELISNTAKYAIPQTQVPEITVLLQESEPLHYRFVYRDNGPGYPEDWSVDQHCSLGLTIVKALTKQLGGEAEFKNNEGAVCESILCIC